jgi:transposase
MSKKEPTRLEVMQRLKERRMRKREATEILGVGTRHNRRLLQSYREHKEKGLISKRRGGPSNNRLQPEVQLQAIDLLRIH